ncbi:MAG: thioredoxin family protein [Verrucomicrobiota bacterium]
MAEVLSTFILHTGDTAPDFSLRDADGNIVRRDEAAGPRGLLVVFACNHCPYVVHVADALGTLCRDLKTMDVGTVAINSNDIALYPQDAAQPMKSFAAEHGWTFPYLLDETQEVAKAYGAACTPDFFLFDGAMRLFYAGQFDESRPHSGKSAQGGDLREALRRMLSGEPPPAAPRPASGCNIKWKPGNQPPWWNAGRPR